MTLPRFTAGAVGNLEFSHLNEAFERIEAMSASPEVAVARTRGIFSRVITVKILERQGEPPFETGSFEEVALATPAGGVYFPIAGGVKSTDGTNPFAAPIVSPVSAPDSIVNVLACVARNGKLYFREFTPPTTEGDMYIVLGATVLQGSTATRSVFSYSLKPAVVNAQGQWTGVGDTAIEGFNGAENPEDEIAAGVKVIGVGSKIPQNTYAARQPIRVGTVVGPAKMQGGRLVFCVPNGYEFRC